MSHKVGKAEVLAYFERPEVVDHYARATANLGLWRSEEAVFTRAFQRTDRLLDLGTGTGRIALSLYELGYRHLMGIDLSKSMIERARKLAQLLEYPVPFQVMDATRMKFDPGIFDGAIFGFNGLMQVPGRAGRRQALAEIRRILRPGGRFVFTTHDRELRVGSTFWEEEAQRWREGQQKAELLEFGDRFEPTELGELFIHVPDTEEVRDDLSATGWEIDATMLRAHLAPEDAEVREFADECRFWVVRKPEA